MKTKPLNLTGKKWLTWKFTYWRLHCSKRHFFLDLSSRSLWWTCWHVKLLTTLQVNYSDGSISADNPNHLSTDIQQISLEQIEMKIHLEQNFNINNLYRPLGFRLWFMFFSLSCSLTVCNISHCRIWFEQVPCCGVHPAVTQTHSCTVPVIISVFM